MSTNSPTSGNTTPVCQVTAWRYLTEHDDKIEVWIRTSEDIFENSGPLFVAALVAIAEAVRLKLADEGIRPEEERKH